MGHDCDFLVSMMYNCCEIMCSCFFDRRCRSTCCKSASLSASLGLVSLIVAPNLPRKLGLHRKYSICIQFARLQDLYNSRPSREEDCRASVLAQTLHRSEATWFSRMAACTWEDLQLIAQLETDVETKAAQIKKWSTQEDTLCNQLVPTSLHHA